MILKAPVSVRMICLDVLIKMMKDIAWEGTFNYVLKVKWYNQVRNTNEKDELQLVRGRKSQLYPSASASRKGRVFAVFWWKLYVSRIPSWRRGWRAANQVLNPPSPNPPFLLPFLLLNSPSRWGPCSSNIFRHSAFKHWVGTSRTWKFSTNRNVCPLFAEICKRSSSEVHSFPHLLDLPQSYNMSRLFVWQTTNKNRQHKRTQKMKTVKHSRRMFGWNFQIWNAMF